MHVAVDRGDERVGQIVAVRIDHGGGVAKAVAGDENVVDHFIGVERVAGLGRIRHGCAGRNGTGHGQAFLLGAEHHLKRECTARGGPEDRDVPGVGGLEGRFVHSHGIVERAGEVGLGRHTVVDGDDLEVTEAGHHDGFRCSRLTRIKDIASAVQVNEELVLVFGGNDIGRHNKDAHAVNGVCFDGDVEALTQGGEGLDRFGCPRIGGLSPLFACLPEAIPIRIARSRDELLHFRADVRGDGERFGGHLQGRIVVRLRTGDGRGQSCAEKGQDVRSNHGYSSRLIELPKWISTGQNQIHLNLRRRFNALAKLKDDSCAGRKRGDAAFISKLEQITGRGYFVGLRTIQCALQFRRWLVRYLHSPNVPFRRHFS